VLRTLQNEYKDMGSYILNFRPSDWYVAPGHYRYRLQAGGQVFQRDIKVG
jgi:hypothetical protein